MAEGLDNQSAYARRRMVAIGREMRYSKRVLES
jgi:hypothetical protein